MDKFSKIEKILMILTFVSATFSFLLNVQNGFTSYSWQLCVLMWVSISYIKQRMIDDCEDDNK